jgi:ferredoxin
MVEIIITASAETGSTQTLMNAAVGASRGVDPAVLPSNWRPRCAILWIEGRLDKAYFGVPARLPGYVEMRLEISPDMLQSEFVSKVVELSGQDINLCYQCGKCSAGCPMSFVMDLLPNQIIRAVQLGLAEDVIRSRTPWLCASCLVCTVRCPKGIDIARVMEAVRQITLRKSEDFVDPAGLERSTVAELPAIALVSGFRKLTG